MGLGGLLRGTFWPRTTISNCSESLSQVTLGFVNYLGLSLRIQLLAWFFIHRLRAKRQLERCWRILNGISTKTLRRMKSLLEWRFFIISLRPYIPFRTGMEER